jgi:hypothetical protein
MVRVSCEELYILSELHVRSEPKIEFRNDYGAFLASSMSPRAPEDRSFGPSTLLLFGAGGGRLLRCRSLRLGLHAARQNAQTLQKLLLLLERHPGDLDEL